MSKIKNIQIAYILALVGELYFPISVWIFYYLRYMNFQEIAILTSVKIISANLFEVPTGAFADVYGRKTAVIWSFFLYGLVMFGYAGNRIFWIFLVLDVIKALASALYSGSLEALVYDSLKEKGEEGEYDKVIANLEAISWMALFLAAIGGGYLYHIWFRAPYIIQGILCWLSLAFASMLVEPKIERKKLGIKEMWQKNWSGMLEVVKNLKIAQATFIFVVIGAGYLTASEILGISQAREYGLDSRGVGWLFGIGYLLSALASKAYPKLRQRFGSRKLLAGAVAMLLISFLLAKYVGVIFGCLLIIGRIASSTTFRNLRSSILNRYFSSENRATALSTVIQLSQLPYAVMAFAIGGYIDRSSPNSLAWLVGVVIVMVLLGQAVVFRIAKGQKR